MSATNGVGWVIEEYCLTTGWAHSIMFPMVFEAQKEAARVLTNMEPCDILRVYEKLS